LWRFRNDRTGKTGVVSDGSQTEDATWVALLRGINLGRNKRVAMADLRKLLAGLGYGEVRTHLQSGNAVFAAPAAGDLLAAATELERAIAGQILADLGLDVAVMVRSGPEVVAVADANPYLERTSDPKQLHVGFLSATPDAETVAAIRSDAYAPDELTVAGRAVYLYRPNGIMGSRLPDLERLLGVRVTERNWNTVSKLRQMVT
jgi:uncharacterized protein (DUF1697 family)